MKNAAAAGNQLEEIHIFLLGGNDSARSQDGATSH
jgi:hypothetical protein